MGPMKMRAAIDDIAEVESVKVVTPLEAARKRGGITVSTANSDTDYMTSEINVIGRTADEAQTRLSGSSTAPSSPACPASASCTAPAWASFAAPCANSSETIPTSPASPNRRKTKVVRALPRSSCVSEGSGRE